MIVGGRTYAVLWSPSGAAPRSEPVSTNIFDMGPGPCPERQSWTLAQARANLPYKVLTPHDPLADQSNMQGVWSCGGTEIAMTFSSGIKAYLDVNGIKDPAVAWAGLAAQDPDYTFVGTAGGQPAALIDPLKDPRWNSKRIGNRGR